jgi:hypothetical protein
VLYACKGAHTLFTIQRERDRERKRAGGREREKEGEREGEREREKEGENHTWLTDWMNEGRLECGRALCLQGCTPYLYGVSSPVRERERKRKSERDKEREREKKTER